MPLTRTPFAAYADASPTVASASAALAAPPGRCTGLATLPPMPMTLTIAPRPRSAMRFTTSVRRMDVAHELRVHRRVPRGGVEFLRRIALRRARGIHQHVDRPESPPRSRRSRRAPPRHRPGPRRTPPAGACHRARAAARRRGARGCATRSPPARLRRRTPPRTRADALAAAGDRDDAVLESEIHGKPPLAFVHILSKRPGAADACRTAATMPHGRWRQPARSRCRVRRDPQGGVRHRTRELRPLVLPPHGPRGDRGRADPRVRDQCRRTRRARGDLFLRLHRAADPGRRARRYAGSAPHPGSRLARRRRRLADVRTGARVGARGGGPHAGGHRRLGRVHRHPQDLRTVVPRQPLRHAVGGNDARRQPGGGDRRRAARLDRHADVVARGVRRARGAVRRARHRDVAVGPRPSRGPRLRPR